MEEGKLILETLARHDVSVSHEYARAMSALREFGPNSEVMLAMNRVMFARDDALAFRMKRHAAHETLGARFIEAIAMGYAEGSLAEEMLSHARDEHRHGRIFMGLYKTLTGAHGMAEDPEGAVAVELDAFDGNLKSFFYATHVAEVRNFFLLEQYLDILSTLDHPHKGKLTAVLEGVKRDEVRHVVYTARHINRWLDDSPAEQDYFRGCLAEYTRMSWQEVALIASFLAEEAPAPAALVGECVE